MSDLHTAESILAYWYSDEIKSQWFNSTPELDQEIKENYESVWLDILQGKYYTWKDSPEGCLSLVIVLDQFPLNMFRGNVKSFSSEGLAIKIAKKAIEQGFDQALDKNRLSFLYMPLMHSENIDNQNLAVQLFEQANLTDNLRFAKHHRDIVKKFGRFPHRNKILQRKSSAEEIDYLKSKEAFTG